MPLTPPVPYRRHVVGRRGLARLWTAAAIALAAVGISLALPEPVAAEAETPYRLAPVTRPLSFPEPPDPADAAPVVRADAAPVGESTPVGLHIPVLNVTSDVVPLGLEDDGSMEVPDGAYPAGWYENGPTPGEVGPAVIVGHIDWADQDGVFAHLTSLRPGDAVYVVRDDASVATFTVERVARFPKADFPTEEVYGELDTAALRLITCGGVFDEDRQDYPDNVVVFASLAG